MIRKAFLLMIKFYQVCISPYKIQSCIFIPSCSSYTYEAITKYGVIKGSMLGIKRIIRCHPFNSGGYDPVP